MANNHETRVELSGLVDIISNVAGMMILLACISLMIRQRADTTEGAAEDEIRAKPINFPLAYIPNKRSVTLCVKYQRIYQLPEKELLEEVAKKTAKGEPIDELEINTKDCIAKIQFVSTLTGYRFTYFLKPDGGIPVNAHSKVLKMLTDILAASPPSRCFYTFHVWPDAFARFREIREYLHEQQAEVGWSPRVYPVAETADMMPYDVSYSIGEYDEALTSIKAQ